jgi:hypothetical protein
MIDKRYHLVAAFHGKGATGTEIILNINDDECRILCHGFTLA